MSNGRFAFETGYSDTEVRRWSRTTDWNGGRLAPIDPELPFEVSRCPAAYRTSAKAARESRPRRDHSARVLLGSVHHRPAGHTSGRTVTSALGVDVNALHRKTQGTHAEKVDHRHDDHGG